MTCMPAALADFKQPNKSFRELVVNMICPCSRSLTQEPEMENTIVSP